jgi:hypothetical protein
MYQPMLFIHWKQARLLLVPFIVAAFGLPLMVVQGLGGGPEGDAVSLSAYQIVTSGQLWLPLFPMLAIGVGAVLALTAWNWDHQLNHVYALTLPLARWEYVLQKMSAGAVLIALPAAALWVGALVASAATALPPGLHTYPNQLALRFLLAVLLSYTMFFAFAAGTIRTTVWIVTGVIAFFLVSDLVSSALALVIPYFQDVNIGTEVSGWLFRVGGPFEVFTGNWSLIDV